MTTVTERRMMARWLSALGVCAGILCVWLLPGCVPVPDDGGDGSPSPGDVTAQIVGPTISFGVSLADLPVAVRYTVTGEPDNIEGFYVPVASAASGSPAIGDRVIIATDLEPGANQFFNFQVDQVGFYRVGVIATVGSRQEIDESNAVITVQGPPEPRFILPTEAVTVARQGDDIDIRFDAGDDENRVQWRLFYLRPADPRNVPPSNLGTQLATGSGNIGNFLWSTDMVAPGDYELGLSATDSGFSVSATVDRGDANRIVTIPRAGVPGPKIDLQPAAQPLPPIASFTQPGATDVRLFRNEAFSIKLSVEIREPTGSGFVEVFHDQDRNDSNGFVSVGTANLAPGPAQALTFALPTDLPQGTYNIGVKVVDGINDPVVQYATGTVSVVRTVTLDVLAPDTALPVRPGEAVEIRWITNAPPSVAEVDVFFQTVDPDTGLSFGPERAILSDVSPEATSATFSSPSVGLFAISVRVDVNDGTFVQEEAPSRVLVSTAPRAIWLGTLAEEIPAFDGAIFGGHQPEDNAGTSFSPAGDLDDDGYDDFVIVARYGKPFFENPLGVSRGEAYIIYGGTNEDRLLGEFNLNSTGTATLRGVTLTGIRTVDGSTETDGLADVTLLPDVDDDGKGELAFGFPSVDSAGGASGRLEADGQFLNGGVVILSSNNSILLNPPNGGSVIDLGRVGQRFSNTSVPEAVAELVLVDRLAFDPVSGQCVAGTDGIPDTIIGPSVGFVSTLAPPAWEQLGFQIYTGPPGPGLCPTQYALAICPGPDVNPFALANAGSGFYPAAAALLEPFGARIIGPEPGDAFGTSITTSNALDDGTPGDLIISAPNRSAQAGFVGGITSDISQSGVAFLTDYRNLWEPDTVFLNGEPPPSPRQYLMGFVSHCGGGRAQSIDALRIAGNVNDNIQVMLGIADVNLDGRNDFAIGAPKANGGQGAVYIAYRREEAIEGDFVLPKLGRDPFDRERLAGLLIRGNSLDALGSSLAADIDLNGDEIPDLVIGSPNAGAGVGEVIVLFGGTGVQSGLGGKTVAALLAERLNNAPVAARITGNSLDAGGGFGFNIANGGDIDGDGLDDLLIAAPGASPRFDPDPNDANDRLTALGLDLDLDGRQDEVPGPNDMFRAGLVYVIYGSNRLDQITTCSASDTLCSTNADCPQNEICAPDPEMTISIDRLGTAFLDGFVIVGRRAGDFLGGGDAGNVGQGGNSAKAGRGRSDGLAGAGDIDGDGRADILIGSILADPRRDPQTGFGTANGGEAYLIYGTAAP